ncbi:hypothetical protein T492DRAFT_314582 [Pavlovales sp. CCMP2436]|nr:hypothetical protein T492DRAFT_314582 [Pavlovales sp. CCMP2436]
MSLLSRFVTHSYPHQSSRPPLETMYAELLNKKAGSLDDVIKQTPADARPRIPEAVMAEIVSQTLEGLAYLHQEQKQVPF